MSDHATNRRQPGGQPPGLSAALARALPLPGLRTGKVAASIYAFGAFLLALVWIIAMAKIATEREVELERLRGESANLASAFEEHTLAALRAVDQVLLMVKADYEERGQYLDLSRYLRKGIIVPEVFNTLVVADERGEIVQASTPVKNVNLSDGEHFQSHAVETVPRLLVGKPALGRATGKWGVPMTRRVSKPDGSYGGMVVAVVDPGYFSRFYQRIDIGRLGTVVLAGRDGVVRARQTGADASVGQDISDSELLQQVARQPGGSYRVVGHIDGVARVVSYRALAEFPLIVAVGIAETDGLAQFEDRRRAYLRGAALLSAVLVVLVAIQRRIAGELEVREGMLADAQRIANVGDWMVYPASGEAMLSEEACRILGRDPSATRCRRDDVLRAVHDEDRAAVIREFEAVVSERGLREFETRIVRPGGEMRWVHVTIEPWRGSARGPTSLHGTMMDITERRQAEQALRVSEERLQLAVRGAAVGIWDWDIARDQFYLSPQLARLLGHEERELRLTAEEYQQRLHPEDRARVLAARDRHLAERAPYNLEFRVRRQDGSFGFFHECGEAARNAAGAAVRFSGSLTDVTARKIAETALAERERRYRTMIDTMSEGIVLRSADRVVLLANPAADRILGTRFDGASYEELRERGWRVLREDESPFPDEEFPPEVTLRTGQAVRHVVMGFRRPDGTLRWVSVNSQPVFDPGAPLPYAVVVTYDDITERRRAEEALRASEERLRATLFNTPGVAVQWFDRDGRVQLWNPASERLYGYRADDVMGRTLTEIGLIGPAQTGAFLEGLAAIERTGSAHGPDELTLTAADGAGVTVIYTMYMIPGHRGAPIFVCMDIDITERKQAEEALRFRHRLDALILQISTRFLLARQNHSAAIDETLADVGRFVAADRCYVSLLDESGDTYSLAAEWCAGGIASKRAVRQHLPAEALWRGIERDEIAYVTVSELPPESDVVRQVLASAGIQSSLRVSIRLGGRLLGVLGLDSVRAERRWPDDVAVLLRVVADILGSTLARDRSEAEIRRLNAELEQRVHDRTVQLEATNQELESFSYSVSHDLRGPLRRIEGFSRILLTSHSDGLDEQARALLTRVRGSTQHMGRLIDDLLKLARVNRQALVRAEVDVSAMTREVLANLAAAEPERRFECTVADGLAVHADRGLMRVVLENLLGNAWKFTGLLPLARIEVGSVEVEADRETAYYVRDNGAGFDMAYAANLFGAFQRLHTREEFDGSGIGLATVRRIITRHGGRVWAEGVPEKGAVFYFTVGTHDLPA